MQEMLDDVYSRQVNYPPSMNTSIIRNILESRQIIIKSRMDIERYQRSLERSEKLIEGFKAIIEEHQQALSKMSEFRRNWIERQDA